MASHGFEGYLGSPLDVLRRPKLVQRLAQCVQSVVKMEGLSMFEKLARSRIESVFRESQQKFSRLPPPLGRRRGTLIWAGFWHWGLEFFKLFHYSLYKSTVLQAAEVSTAAPQLEKLGFSDFPPGSSNKLILLRGVCTFVKIFWIFFGDRVQNIWTKMCISL